jgi:hypothetical protein
MTDLQWDQNPNVPNTDQSAKTLSPAQLDAANAQQAKLGHADATRAEKSINNYHNGQATGPTKRSAANNPSSSNSTIKAKSTGKKGK